MYEKRMNAATFYILSFTWGIIMSVVGLIVGAVLLLCGKRPFKNQYGWTFIMGHNWGGVEFGFVSIVQNDASEHTVRHEFGHAVQNCYFGPFQVLISLSSAIRYWWREFLVHVCHKKYSDLPPYDSIWFEGQASKLGDFYYTH